MTSKPSLSLTLYDTQSLLAEKTISPYAGRVRILLNYKKISYETVWLDYSKVESTAKAVGALPTGTKADGNPFYTIPFMKVVPADGAPEFVLSESSTIAAFLDRTFEDPDPTHPRELLPQDALIYQDVFRKSLLNDFFLPIVGVLLPEFYNKLSPSEAEWFASTRKAVFGFEWPGPRDSEAETAAWAVFDKAFDGLAARLDILGEGNFRVVKDRVTYSEIEMVAIINGLKKISPEKGWKRIKSRNDERWQKLLELYEDYLPKPLI